MALLLFGGALSVVHEGGYVLVDDWLRIRASAPTAVLVKKLRAALDALLADKVKRTWKGLLSKEHSATLRRETDQLAGKMFHLICCEICMGERWFSSLCGGLQKFVTTAR